MSKIDQFCRWSTKDLINFLIIIVWSICQKKKPLVLGCLLYVIIYYHHLIPSLFFIFFFFISSYTFMNLQYKNPAKKKNNNDITQSITNFSIQKYPASSQTTQIGKPHKPNQPKSLHPFSNIVSFIYLKFLTYTIWEI